MLQHLSFDWPQTTPAIREAVNQAIESGDWGKYHGPWTDRLKVSIKRWLPAQHSILCCSGTIAVELALRGAGVTAGDHVLIAGYDFPGNFRAIEAIGALPVVVDVSADSWVIAPKRVLTAITPRTTAVIVSHLHGQIADIPSIRTGINQSTSDSPPPAIIEDVCQSPGGQLGQQFLGTLGDVAAFSFGGSKLLSAGRGGAVTTNNASIAQRIKIFTERGNDAFPLSQLQAAALLSQLDDLPRLTRQRFAAAKYLSQRINQIEGLKTLDLNEPGQESSATPALYKLPIRITDARISRDVLINRLTEQGLPVGSGFRGFHRRSKKRCLRPFDLPASQSAAAQTILLHHPVLLHEEPVLNDVVECIETTAEELDTP